MSFLANYVAKMWVNIVLKSKDSVLAHLSNDISLEDKMRISNYLLLILTDIFPFD